jgi:hypothetical protein
LIGSCTQDPSGVKPEVFLEKEELIDVIVDLQILESHYHTKYQRSNVYANALDSASYFIFEHHQISKDIFKSNLNYYFTQQDTLYTIYESALDTINNRINSTIQ